MFPQFQLIHQGDSRRRERLPPNNVVRINRLSAAVTGRSRFTYIAFVAVWTIYQCLSIALRPFLVQAPQWGQP